MRVRLQPKLQELRNLSSRIKVRRHRSMGSDVQLSRERGEVHGCKCLMDVSVLKTRKMESCVPLHR